MSNSLACFVTALIGIGVSMLIGGTGLYIGKKNDWVPSDHGLEVGAAVAGALGFMTAIIVALCWLPSVIIGK